MADISDFRKGLTIVWRDELWMVSDFLHVKPGKGGAFVRTTLKNVRNGTVREHAFKGGDHFEIARVERRPHQYLYADDLGLHFMDLETYEQTMLPREIVEGYQFLKEGGELDVLIYVDEDEPVRAEVPEHVELAVEETDPGLRGDTATGGTKPATLEGGATVSVPLFIAEGDVVRVNTETGEYVTRVSEG